MGCASVSTDSGTSVEGGDSSDDVSGLLRGQLGGTSDDEFERLIAAEVAEPGSVRKAATGLFERPDGPLEPVTVTSACERVDKVAADRWGVDPGHILRPTDLGSIVALLEHGACIIHGVTAGWLR